MTKDDMIFHFEWLDLFEQVELTKEEQMQVIFAAIEYVRKGINPTFSDRLLKSVWFTMKQRIDHDLEKYKSQCERNRANGARGGRPKKPETQKPNGFSENPEKPKKPDIDSDIDTDIDIESEFEKDSLSLEREDDWRERVFEFFLGNDFQRDPQEFIDYNLGLGHKFDDPTRWQAWARQWEARKNE